jgi:hypothetical protein
MMLLLLTLLPLLLSSHFIATVSHCEMILFFRVACKFHGFKTKNWLVIGDENSARGKAWTDDSITQPE